jgi:hypothetical protein
LTGEQLIDKYNVENKRRTERMDAFIIQFILEGKKRERLPKALSLDSLSLS